MMMTTSKAYNLIQDDDDLEGLFSSATAYSIRYSAKQCLIRASGQYQFVHCWRNFINWNTWNEYSCSDIFLKIKTTKEMLDHLWIFKLVLWLTIDEGYSNGYVQPQYSPDQTSAYGQWNCRNFIFLWMPFQRVDPAPMADPPPSGSPQGSTSPEVGSRQCYVGKSDPTLVSD